MQDKLFSEMANSEKNAYQEARNIHSFKIYVKTLTFKNSFIYYTYQFYTSFKYHHFSDKSTTHLLIKIIKFHINKCISNPTTYVKSVF